MLPTLALLALVGCSQSPPAQRSSRPPLDPTVVVTEIRTDTTASVHKLLRDTSRDLPHSAIGKPWDDVAGAIRTSAEKHISQGTSRIGTRAANVNQASVIRTVAVGEDALPFRLETRISAIDQPGSIVDACNVSLELDRHLDSAPYIDGTALPTNTVLDDIFKTPSFLACCQEFPEIIGVSIRFQAMSHGREEVFTKGFLVQVTFRDEASRTTSSLTFEAESGLDPPVDYHGNRQDDAPFAESDTWQTPKMVGEGGGSWQPTPSG